MAEMISNENEREKSAHSEIDKFILGTAKKNMKMYEEYLEKYEWNVLKLAEAYSTAYWGYFSIYEKYNILKQDYSKLESEKLIGTREDICTTPKTSIDGE